MIPKHGSASPEVIQPRSSTTTGMRGDLSPRYDMGAVKPESSEEPIPTATLANDEGTNNT
jgi:hypothetical protein